MLNFTRYIGKQKLYVNFIFFFQSKVWLAFLIYSYLVLKIRMNWKKSQTAECTKRFSVLKAKKPKFSMLRKTRSKNRGSFVPTMIRALWWRRKTTTIIKRRYYKTGLWLYVRTRKRIKGVVCVIINYCKRAKVLGGKPMVRCKRPLQCETLLIHSVRARNLTRW